MKKVLIIIQREYWSRVLTKTFLLTTFLAPLGFAVLIGVSVWSSMAGISEKRVAVIDESGIFKDTRLPDAENKSVYFFYPKNDFESLYESMQSSDGAMAFDALLRIPQGFDVMKPNRIGIQVYTADRPGIFMKQYLADALSEVVRKKKLEQLLINSSEIEKLNEKVLINYTSGFENEKAGFTEVASVIGYLIGIIIYFALMIYGSMIMRGIKEEKTNRIVEVLISSVKPFQLMLGKIIGIGLVGLSQFALWLVLILIINFFLVASLGLSSSNEMIQTSSTLDADDLKLVISHLASIKFLPLLLVTLFFFIGGFLLYGALFAAIGAAINDDGDAQSLMLPITLPIIISIILLTNVIGNPDGSIALWTSLIPFSSPIILPSLMPFEPPLWQILLSAVFLILGFILTTWFAAKIYRTGILMYGKKVSFKELIKWGFK